MSSILTQLSNEAILLMYLAGELSAEDTAEVERLLAADERLRAEFETLRDAHAAVDGALRDADAGERLALPASTAARRVGAAVNAWHARRLQSAPATGPRRRIRFPWWSYPLASAAAIVIAFTAWWGVQPDDGLPDWVVAPFTAPGPMPVVDLEAEREADTVVITSGPFARDDVDDKLDELEAELYALSVPIADVDGVLGPLPSSVELE